MATFQLNQVKNLGSSEFEGTLVTSARNTLINKKRLLPLSPSSRILTSAEELEYPSLASVLPTHASFTEAPKFHGPTLTSGILDKDTILASSSDGNTLLYIATDGHLSRISTTDYVTLLSMNAGSFIQSIACSSDASVIAVLYWDESVGAVQIKVSTDSGVSFGVSYTGAIDTEYLNGGNIYVSPDGSVVAAVCATNTGTIEYIRIDAPNISIVPDVSSIISNNLVRTTGVTPVYASFSEDGTSFVLTYVYGGGGGVNRNNAEITEDSGATFTPITNSVFSPFLISTSSGANKILMDPIDNDRLLGIQGDSVGTIWYSKDKGVSWSLIEPMLPLDSFAINTGWAAASTYSPYFLNGTAMLKTEEGSYVLLSLDIDGNVDNVERFPMSPKDGFVVYSLKEDVSKENIGVAGVSLASGIRTIFGGLLTFGKQIPSAPHQSHSKIVADAP